MMRLCIPYVGLCLLISMFSDRATNAQELDQLPRARALTYEFEDTDIATIERYLRFAGIRLPIRISGQLSGWVWGQNQGSFFSLSDYRIETKITSPVVNIEGNVLHNVSLRLAYESDVWTLRSITADLVPGSNSTEEDVYLSFEGSGALPPDPTADVSLNLAVRDLILVRLFEALNQQGINVSGVGEAQMNATVKRSQLSDLNAWKADGRFTLQDVQHPAILQSQLVADFTVQDRLLQLDNATVITAADGRLRFSGSLKLDESSDFTFQAPQQPVILERLFSNQSQEQLDGIVLQEPEFAIDGSGTLSPLVWEFNVAGRSSQIGTRDLALKNVSLLGPISNTKLGPLALSGSIGDGTVNGEYSIQSYSNDDAKSTATVRVERVNVMELVPGTETLPGEAVVFSGDANVSWLGWQPETPQELFGSANGTVETTLLQNPPGPFEVQLKRLDNGDFSFQTQTGENVDYLRATGTINWTDWNEGDYSASTQFSRLQLDLSQLISPSDLPSGLANQVQATGQASVFGTLANRFDSARFDINYVTGQFEDAPLGIKNLVGSVDQERLHVESFSAFLNERLANGSAMIRFDNTGFHNANLELRDWPLKELLELSGGPVPVADLDGEISANLNLKKLAEAEFTKGWAGAGSLVGNNLVYNGNQIGAIKSIVDSDQQRMKVRFEGNLFDGSVDGVVMLDSRESHRDFPILGSISLTDAVIPKLFAVWQPRNQASVFSGTTTGKIDFGLDGSNNLRGNLELLVNGLSYQDQKLTDSARIVGTFNNERLAIDRFDTAFGEGRLRGRATARFDQGFSLDGLLEIQRVNLVPLISLADAALAASFQGKVSGRLVTRFRGDQLTLRGSADGRALDIFGIPIEDATSQITGSYKASSSALSLRLNNINGHAFGGRVKGDYQMTYARCLGMESDFEITNGDVASLEEFISTGELFGSGVFNADMQINSRCYTSLADLNGKLAMSFGPTDAKSVPLMNPISSAIPVAGLPQTRFDTGSLDATIGGGIMRIQNSLLYNPTLWISATGSVGLINQNLDLDTTVYTGSTANSQVLNVAVQNLALIPEPSTQAFAAVLQAISNRTIFLKIGGTANSPVVRIQTGRTVGRYVVESFVRQFARGAVTVGATASASN